LIRGGSGNLAWGRRGSFALRGLDRGLEGLLIEVGEGVQLVVQDGVDIWLVVESGHFWLEVEHEVSSP